MTLVLPDRPASVAKKRLRDAFSTSEKTQRPDSKFGEKRCGGRRGRNQPRRRKKNRELQRAPAKKYIPGRPRKITSGARAIKKPRGGFFEVHSSKPWDSQKQKGNETGAKAKAVRSNAADAGWEKSPLRNGINFPRCCCCRKERGGS